MTIGIPKPNLSQLATMLTILGLLIGWYFSYSSKVEESKKNHEDSLIKQHDQDQRLDSIVTAFAIFAHDFSDLQKNWAAGRKQRDVEKEENDKQTIALKIELITLETEFHDYLKYKK